MGIKVVVRNRVADRFLSYYQAKDDGEIVVVEITEQEYADLALSGAGEPKRPQLPEGKTWVWKQSVGGALTLDTPDGTLRAGDYYPGDEKIPPLLHYDGKLLELDKKKITLNGDELTIEDGA